jgi:hypothetical protein
MAGVGRNMYLEFYNVIKQIKCICWILFIEITKLFIKLSKQTNILALNKCRVLKFN